MTPQWEVTKSFNVAVAHYIPGHKGKCKNLHGHNLEIFVTIVGKELDNLGMLIDFGNLKDIVQKGVMDKIDHCFLNDTFYEIDSPTVENLSKWIFDYLTKYYFNGKLKIKEIAIKESESSIVRFYYA